LNKAAELGLLAGSVDLALKSNIPDGAGLSSSSALVAAVLRACCKLSGKSLDPVDLAMASRAVENEYIGMPCGTMDQMAIALTTPGHALALDTASMRFDLVEIPDAFSFVILHSGVHRKLSDGRYKVRFEECEAARKVLGAEFLCLLDEAQISRISLLEDNLSARARHVVSEHKRTLAAIEALRAEDATQMGRLMNESHISYSEDFAASTPEIDALVKTCVEKGAYGARLTGGGFGGCVVCLVKSAFEDEWANAVLAMHPNASRVV
jgi:galactokinase